MNRMMSIEDVDTDYKAVLLGFNSRNQYMHWYVIFILLWKVQQLFTAVETDSFNVITQVSIFVSDLELDFMNERT